MKSVRMVTFHTPRNYGAVLQAFGLLTYLKKCINDVSVIDYDTEHLRQIYPVLPSPNNLKSFVVYCLMLPHCLAIKRMHDKFDKFKIKYLNLTRRFETYDALYETAWNAETVFCTGSDQVFNPNRIEEERRVFFLDFVPKECQRVSYAASFGVGDIPQEKVNEISSYLSKFQSISVREKSGSHIVKSLVQRDVPVVLDPVFLCEKKDWEGIIVDYKRKFCDYLLYYKVLNNRASDQYAYELAKKKKLKLVVITKGFMRIRCDEVLYDVGPEEFLWLVNGADFVVTDAFHGVAFSVIFQKQFVFSDTGRTTNNRGIELLKTLGLQNVCYCEKYEQSHMINYDRVNVLLAEKIGYSKSYIAKAFNF